MIGRLAHASRRYRQFNWALADQAMISLANFAMTIIVGRLLGVDVLGQFALAMTVVALSTALQQALIVSPMMSLGPKLMANESRSYFGAVCVHELSLAILIFLTILIGGGIAANLIDFGISATLMLPLSTAVAAHQLQDFLRRYFFTTGRPVVAFSIDGLRYVGQLAVLILLLLNLTSGASSQAITIEVILYVIGGTSIAAACLGAATLRDIGWSAITWRNAARQHWQFGSWLVGSVILNWVSANLLILVAGAMLGVTAVGALRAAQTILGPVYVIFQGLDNVMPVRAAWHVGNRSTEALRAYLMKICMVFGPLTAVIASIAALAPELWLNLAFGSEFAGYGFLVRWYALAYLIWFFVLPLRSGLRAIEDTKAIFRGDIVAAGIAIILALPLLTIFDEAGVPVGILLTQLTLIVIFRVALRSRLS